MSKTKDEKKLGKEKESMEQQFDSPELFMNDLQKQGILRLTVQIEQLQSKRKEEFFSSLSEVMDLLWETLCLFQNFVFYTAQKLDFVYRIRGNEMFISRKGKSITRSTVNVALQKALELKKNGVPVSGPKKLGCFGASYLYPVFIHLGIIEAADKLPVKSGPRDCCLVPGQYDLKDYLDSKGEPLMQNCTAARQVKSGSKEEGSG